MDKFGLKGTFNINSGMYLPEDTVRERYYGRMKKSEAKALYTNSGHEVATHTVNHPHLERLDADEMMYEITKDIESIEKEYGVTPRGMAYPYGTYDDNVLDALEKCNIAYARTVKSTYEFQFPDNWLLLHPTCHHRYENLTELAEKFVENKEWGGSAEMFYLWGHSYEFDKQDNWEVIEKFAEYVGNRDYIWYATNIEVYDYVKAYESLEISSDKRTIYNPSSIDVWFKIDGEDCLVKAKETLRR